MDLVAHRLRRFVSGRSLRSQALWLLVPAIAIYAIMILFFATGSLGADIVADLTGGEVLSHPDLPFYQNRTSAVLAGEIPYLDFETESPPLIIYLMVPAQLLGGSITAYAAMFSAYGMVAALCILLALRRVDDGLAFGAAVLFLYNPITVVTATVYVQDEMVVALFYVLPLLLLVMRKGLLALGTAIAGMFVKVFSGVLVPLAVLKAPTREERVRHLIGLVALVVLFALPFLILAPDKFLEFPLYYLSQSGIAGEDEGISFWRFLHDAGLTTPGWLLQTLFIGGTLGMLYVVWRRDVEPVAAGYLMFLPFLLFFPKIFSCYLVIAMAPVAVMAMREERYLWAFGLASLLSCVLMLFVSYDGTAVVPPDGALIAVPIAMSALMLSCFAWIGYDAQR